MKENLGGATVELTAADRDSIQKVLAQVQIHGERYPAQMQALVNR